MVPARRAQHAALISIRVTPQCTRLPGCLHPPMPPVLASPPHCVWNVMDRPHRTHKGMICPSDNQLTTWLTQAK